MPTVHPQVQKARDLMPLIAAASDQNDEIRELTINPGTHHARTRFAGLVLRVSYTRHANH
jgi:hypothetical protein